MKAIMYHYVRAPLPDLPYFRFLHVEDFRRQLDYFAATSGFVGREEFLGFLKGEPVPGGKILLTFDDSLKDHSTFVLPEILRRELFAIFYVPTGIYQTYRLLDVHRVHLLLGRHGGSRILKDVSLLITDEMVSENEQEEFKSHPYSVQNNDEATTTVKKLLNYLVSDSWRTEIIDQLMSTLMEDEDKIADHFYMSKEDIGRLVEMGMLIGSHSVSHPVFSRLHIDDQRRELVNSFDFIDKICGSGSLRNFAYPYGAKYTYTEETITLLNQLNCQFAMTAEEGDIQGEDFMAHAQELPRYDCNQFMVTRAALELCRGPV